ncbi:hypothetical protein ACMGGS_07965 [Superficieibacter sp. BNK-5]|uniref:hypothetical protein n=1 Tax=Superficieibacter sp. BNK-5 TaxID=3376142 RepID=UPI0039BF44D4
MKMIFLLLCMINFSANAYECTSAKYDKAESAIDNLNTWADLSGFYNKFKECDEGSVSEGLSEIITSLLANHWNELPEFEVESKKNLGFEYWSLNHIDKTVNDEDLNKIIVNVKELCPKGMAGICFKLGEKTRKVLNED